jgi:hypothetical protein
MPVSSVIRRASGPSLRQVATTRQPRSRNADEIALPSPRVPPVTKASLSMSLPLVRTVELQMAVRYCWRIAAPIVASDTNRGHTTIKAGLWRQV